MKLLVVTRLLFLAAEVVGGGGNVNGGGGTCAQPFLEVHRRLLSVDGRVDRQLVLAQTCRQVMHLAQLPTTIFCDHWNTQRPRDARDATAITFGPTNLIIIQLDDKIGETTEKMMEWLISSNQKTLWESNFLVWLRGEEIDAVAVFKVAWKFRILKITVAVQNFEDEVQFFKTISESGGVCEGKEVPRLTLCGKCIKGHLELDELKMRQVYVRDLQGCQLNVSTIHFPPSVILFKEGQVEKAASTLDTIEPIGGIDVQIIKTVAESMNFSTRFYVPPDGLGWGVGHANGSFSGLLGEVASGRADMGAACLMPIPIRYKFFAVSRSYGDRSMAWAVPLPKLQPQWIVLVEVFTPSTWAVVATALLLAVIAIWALAKNSMITDGAFLYVWASVLGVSLVDMPRANWTRLILTGWLLAFLVLGAAYQGALFSSLAKPRHQKALDTLEDIVRQGLPLVGHPNFINLLGTEDPEVSAKALKLYRATANNVLGQMDTMAKGGEEVACLINKEMLVWYNYENRHKGKKVHIAKEVATSYPTMVFLRRNSALTPRFNVLVSRLVESGLVNKWYTDLTSAGTKGATDAPAQVLELHNLSGIFLAQAIGLMISILVFLLELIVGKYTECISMPDLIL